MWVWTPTAGVWAVFVCEGVGEPQSVRNGQSDPARGSRCRGEFAGARRVGRQRELTGPETKGSEQGKGVSVRSGRRNSR